jgi:alpha-beta hydrolase superfamily lysophospholipase
MAVELVFCETADGVRLDGALSTPPRVNGASGPDLVIIHHGVGNNFYSPGFFGPITGFLLERGAAVVLVNNRGHDYLYLRPAAGMATAEATAMRRNRGPLGAAAEIIEDSLLDWEAWLEWARGAGYRRILLWGHSLGAVKSIYFLAQRSASPGVLGAIASSPPRFSHSAFLQSELAADFRANFDRAQSLAAAGEGDAILSVTFPTLGYFTARTFLDKYGPEERYDILKHAVAAPVPLLITLGSEEKSPLYRDLAASGESLAGRNPAVSFQLIAGADHAYTGKVDALWAAARTWLDRLRVPAAV